MKLSMKTTLLSLTVVAALACASSAFALTYGNNITVSDGEIRPYAVAKEDNETEYEMVQSQGWDLEGMFLKGNKLTMIGGFDFFSTKPNNTTYTSGDVFISTRDGFGGTGSSTTQGNNVVKNTFGYEYALSVDWINKIFKIVDLTGPDTRTQTVYYSQNTDTVPGSNPWKYYDRGTVVGAVGAVIDGGRISDADSGFSDWGEAGDLNHYVVSFDLTDFFTVANLYGRDFDVHFTMGCGNDNLMGNATAPVPEPSTIVLMGAGLLVAGLVRRRSRK